MKAHFDMIDCNGDGQLTRAELDGVMTSGPMTCLNQDGGDTTTNGGDTGTDEGDTATDGGDTATDEGDTATNGGDTATDTDDYAYAEEDAKKDEQPPTDPFGMIMAEV